jgi:trans-aconitate 2-methyltransferase
VAWDAAQYGKFAGERSRPFFDLLARVPAIEPSLVVDLGCGTGELTAALAERWPKARVIGVDNSAEMLAGGQGRAGRVERVNADLAEWRPPAPVDLVFSNAAVQWVPDHERLMAHLVGMLASGGVLAVQMPANFDAPSHTELRAVAAEWKLAPRTPPVQPLESYVRRGWELGCAVEAWETTYVHVLAGRDAVFEWVKGTALLPFVSQVAAAERERFLGDYKARLRAAYPETEQGTMFPFRRYFFVAVRRG